MWKCWGKGQTGFNESKQLQIEHFLRSCDIDILHLQESHLDELSFQTCSYISANYQILKNNSNSKYGTASLIRNSFEIDNIIFHESGRIIIFNLGNITLGKIYLPSGTDGPSRKSRERFCADILPILY